MPPLSSDKEGNFREVPHNAVLPQLLTCIYQVGTWALVSSFRV
jgi:hypothetical protein